MMKERKLKKLRITKRKKAKKAKNVIFVPFIHYFIRMQYLSFSIFEAQKFLISHTTAFSRNVPKKCISTNCWAKAKTDSENDDTKFNAKNRREKIAVDKKKMQRKKISAMFGNPGSLPAWRNGQLNFHRGETSRSADKSGRAHFPNLVSANVVEILDRSDRLHSETNNRSLVPPSETAAEQESLRPRQHKQSQTVDHPMLQGQSSTAITEKQNEENRNKDLMLPQVSLMRANSMKLNTLHVGRWASTNFPHMFCKMNY